jgi:hypothetical protein
MILFDRVDNFVNVGHIETLYNIIMGKNQNISNDCFRL